MFQERIREHYESLTPGFRKLADFIMNSTLDAAFLTATELSRRVGVDPATVVRFSQEIGYSGYRELSREIKRYVRDRVTSTYRQAEEAESEEELLRALQANVEQNLEHFASTEMPNLAEAVQVLKGATRIWIAGEFPSYHLAEHMAKSMAPLSIPVSSFHPGMSETASVLPEMQEGEVLLAISLGTPGLDTGYAVKLAGEKGLKTICITNHATSLPARESDVTVTTPARNPLGIVSFSLALLILGLLWEALLSSQSEEVGDYFASTQSDMGELLNMRAETPPYEVEH